MMARREGSGGRALALAAVFLGACYRHAPVPAAASPCPCRAHGADLDPTTVCTSWPSEYSSHATFPELVKESCYVRVNYPGAKPDPIPEGCGYTPGDLGKELARYDAIARGDNGDLPLELRCAMPPDEQKRAAAFNATTLRALPNKTYPYAAISTFRFRHLPRKLT